MTTEKNMAVMFCLLERIITLMATELVKYFLTHADEMNDCVKKARELVLSKYTIEFSV